MFKTRSRFAPLVLAAALALGAGACSASSTTTEGATNEPAAAATAVDVAPTVATATPAPVVEEADAGADAAPTAEATEATQEAPSQEAAGTGTVEIAFDDGRTWSLETLDCYTAPDAPFGIFFMVGVNDEGADFGAVESWPLDGDKTGGTSFISTFIDEEGNLYGIEGGPVTDNGGELSFSSAIYEGLALEPTLNGTFSCTP